MKVRLISLHANTMKTKEEEEIERRFLFCTAGRARTCQLVS